MGTVYQAHGCNPRDRAGFQPAGSIWQCDDCDRYWVVNWLLEVWVPLRWYHFDAKARIAASQ